MKYVHVVYQDAVYEIPEIWMVGQTMTLGRTVLEAVRVWHEQAELAKAYREQVRRGQ